MAILITALTEVLRLFVNCTITRLLLLDRLASLSFADGGSCPGVAGHGNKVEEYVLCINSKRSVF